MRNYFNWITNGTTPARTIECSRRSRLLRKTPLGKENWLNEMQHTRVRVGCTFTFYYPHFQNRVFVRKIFCEYSFIFKKYLWKESPFSKFLGLYFNSLLISRDSLDNVLLWYRKLNLYIKYNIMLLIMRERNNRRNHFEKRKLKILSQLNIHIRIFLYNNKIRIRIE